MPSNNYPQFDAAVSELTTRVEGLITRVQQTDTYHNIALSEGFAQDAEQSATAADASADSAAASAATATNKAAESEANAASIVASAATATTKAAEATTSAASSSASSSKAQKWAEEVENTPVETGKYSAKHHANKAAASSTDATTKATEAATSATSAAGSATTATTKAADAATSATNAAGSAATATTKASEASASATSAGSSAASATAKATEAATSATSSANSAATASTKASEAATSASVAGTGASVASTKATEASNSASSAAASATTATSKAGEAVTSASSATASQLKAQKWAEEVENTAVETGKFSAKHHAAKAAVSATTATTKAAEADTSATNASTSANTATTKAGEAAASATSASTSATTATTKAGEAVASATSAATGANTATTKAGEAVASANKAQKWADEVTDTPVETGKYSAKHHATKAAASASAAEAASSAALASQQASEAAETDAAASAAEAATYRDQALQAAATATGNLTELGGVDLSSGAYPTKPATGAFWKVTVAGSVDLVDYGVGDTLVYSKNLDQFYKIDNTESVSSIQGETGAVVLTPAKIGALPAEGTAVAASKLATSRTINGVAFDGTGNIVVLDGSKEPQIPAGTSAQYWSGEKQWADLGAAVRNAVLTGYLTGANTAVLATDTVLSAVQKLQGQVNSRQAAHANLAALAGLTGAANKGAYFTAAGAMAVYDLTLFGRQVAACADNSALRTLLALGDVATRDATTSPTDTTSGRLWRTDDLVKQTSGSDVTAGRVMLTGSGGWMTRLSPLESSDLNSVTYGQFYRSGGAAANRPSFAVSANSSGFYIPGGTADRGTQFFSSDSSAVPRIAVRNLYGIDTWGSWAELWHSLNFDPTAKADLSGADFSGSVAVPQLKVVGNSSGDANQAVINFYDLDGVTLRGQIGDYSNTTDDIHVRATTGDLRLVAAGDIVANGQTLYDSGWINITLKGGWATWDGRTPRYRIIGDEVRLQGGIFVAAASNNTAFWTVPTAIRAARVKEVFPATGGGFGVTAAAVYTGDFVSLTANDFNPGSSAIIVLDNVRWVIT